LPSLIKGRPSTTNNNKAKCIPGGTLRVLAGKNKNPESIALEIVMDRKTPPIRTKNNNYKIYLAFQ
jgi:hypothetical protein